MKKELSKFKVDLSKTKVLEFKGGECNGSGGYQKPGSATSSNTNNESSSSFSLWDWLFGKE